MPRTEDRNGILDGSLFDTFYSLQLSANRRFNSRFTLVFMNPPSADSNEWETYLQQTLRDTDIIFRYPAPLPYQVLLTNSQEKEGEYFVSRILEGWKKNGHDPTGIAASILKISSGQAALEDVLKTGRNALLQVSKNESTAPYVIDRSFARRDKKVIKVSIIEEDLIVTNVLSNLLERAVVNDLDIQLRIFHDGFEFLESDWYHSDHTHVVILNDLLPKKNGLEVLQTLRDKPNERKFHIFMMTQRMSEEEMIYAYEKGVDEYIIKPFNPKLFEAQVKKVLGRL